LNGAKAGEEDIVTSDLSLELFDATIACVPLFVDVALLPSNQRFFVDVGVTLDIGVVRDLELVPL
jgi:hypothetical protein